MPELRTDPALAPALAALGRAGLELREDADDAGRYEVTGNTFAHKDLLKRVGGRWRATRQCWGFDSLESIARLAAALPANGAAAASGLADAPAPYDQDRPSFARLRKRAQNAGHRNRLRTRFLEAGADALPDYELLELLLFFSVDVKDTKPLAKELLARYGSLGAILKAEPGRSPSSTTCARSTPRSTPISPIGCRTSSSATARPLPTSCPRPGSAGAPTSRTARAAGRSSGCGGGARPRSCSRRSASSSSGCCARRSGSAR
jgi:hypothetical protein